MRCIVFIIVIYLSATLQAQTAKEIVQKADEKLRGNTSQAELTIKTVRPNWTRTIIL
jgi:hypothetical protein